MRQLLRWVIRSALLRTAGKNRYQSFFETLHEISLRGMNYRSGDLRFSGELHVMQEVARKKSHQGDVVLFDVGANVGAYSAELARVFSAAGCRPTIHAFEPSKTACAALRSVAAEWPCVLPQEIGLGDGATSAILHYDRLGSGLGSIHQRDLRSYGIDMGLSQPVALTTLDDYCGVHGVTHVDFLKIDTEGNECAVLAGARGMIAAGRIDYIQFEFGEAAMDARRYLRDCFGALPGYRLSRVTRDGLRALGGYREEHEIFRTINFLAERETASGGT